MPDLEVFRGFEVLSMRVVVALDAGIVGSEGTRLLRLMAGQAVHLKRCRGFLHGAASNTWSERREILKDRSHPVLALMEFVLVGVVAFCAVGGRGPLVRTRLGLIQFRNLGVFLHLLLAVVFQQKTRGKCGVVVVVVATRSLTGAELKIFMGLQVFKSDLVTVGAKVVWNGDAHFTGDTFVVLAMAGDAVGGLDLAGEDDVLGVLKFPDGVGV